MALHPALENSRASHRNGAREPVSVCGLLRIANGGVWARLRPSARAAGCPCAGPGGPPVDRRPAWARAIAGKRACSEMTRRRVGNDSEASLGNDSEASARAIAGKEATSGRRRLGPTNMRLSPDPSLGRSTFRFFLERVLLLGARFFVLFSLSSAGGLPSAAAAGRRRLRAGVHSLGNKGAERRRRRPPAHFVVVLVVTSC